METLKGNAYPVPNNPLTFQIITFQEFESPPKTPSPYLFVFFDDKKSLKSFLALMPKIKVMTEGFVDRNKVEFQRVMNWLKEQTNAFNILGLDSYQEI